MASPELVNRAVCEFFGVDPRKTVAVTVRVRAGRYPTITVHSRLTEQAEIVVERRFRLVEDEGSG